VSYERHLLFSDPHAVDLLRRSMARVRKESPFKVPAGVVLPDHLHLIWSLPRGDTNYAARIGRMKILFTRALRGARGGPGPVGESRARHREHDVWQRRFWEHTIDTDDDFENHLHYIHYNPLKHGLVSCPHQWAFSSFPRWVQAGLYESEWGCRCRGRDPKLPDLTPLDDRAGE
jgi:putative transposase